MGELRAGLVLVVLIVGCGGNGSGPGGGGASPGTCTITLSGATTATSECIGSLLDETEAGGPDVPFISLVGILTNDFGFDFKILPVTAATGTYMTGNKSVFASGSIRNNSAAGGQQWLVSENDEPSVQKDVGSYNLQVTAVASAPAIVQVSNKNVKQWNIEGTLDATYAPRADSGATGDVTVHVAFHDRSMI
jgi:hypothetical protein